MPSSFGGGTNNQETTGRATENNRTGNHNPSGTTTTTAPDPPHKSFTYTYFTSCNPPNFSGKEGVAWLIKWIEEIEQKLKISQCLEEHKVMYASCSFTVQGLTWWNNQIRTLGTATTDNMPWNEFKTLLLAKYCPMNEIQKLEEEFWNHTMIGAEHQKYTNRFHELRGLLPDMFSTEVKLVEKYVKVWLPRLRAW